VTGSEDVTAVNWAGLRKCPVCFAEIGDPCLSLSGLTAGAGVAVVAPAPHSSRKPRTGRT
jgi:hypothetical protein